MQTRTYPYGTKKQGKVLGRYIDQGRVVLTIAGDDGEGYILVAAGDSQKGRRIEMEFCQGGPTGGYWRVAKEFHDAP